TRAPIATSASSSSRDAPSTPRPRARSSSSSSSSSATPPIATSPGKEPATPATPISMGTRKLMANQSTRPRRRQYLIDRKFQLPVALALAGIGLAMLIYHLAVVHFIVTGAREGAVMETRPITTMLPLVALLVLSFGWLGIHVTHRIVGPAYRLIQTMKA